METLISVIIKIHLIALLGQLGALYIESMARGCDRYRIDPHKINAVLLYPGIKCRK